MILMILPCHILFPFSTLSQLNSANVQRLILAILVKRATQALRGRPACPLTPVSDVTVTIKLQIVTNLLECALIVKEVQRVINVNGALVVIMEIQVSVLNASPADVPSLITALAAHVFLMRLMVYQPVIIVLKDTLAETVSSA